MTDIVKLARYQENPLFKSLLNALADEIERLRRTEDDGADALRAAGIELFELKAEIERLRGRLREYQMMEGIGALAHLQAEIGNMEIATGDVPRTRTPRGAVDEAK